MNVSTSILTWMQEKLGLKTREESEHILEMMAQGKADETPFDERQLSRIVQEYVDSYNLNIKRLLLLGPSLCQQVSTATQATQLENRLKHLKEKRVVAPTCDVQVLAQMCQLQNEQEAVTASPSKRSLQNKQLHQLLKSCFPTTLEEDNELLYKLFPYKDIELEVVELIVALFPGQVTGDLVTNCIVHHVDQRIVTIFLDKLVANQQKINFDNSHLSKEFNIDQTTFFKTFISSNYNIEGLIVKFISLIETPCLQTRNIIKMMIELGTSDDIVKAILEHDKQQCHVQAKDIQNVLTFLSNPQKLLQTIKLISKNVIRAACVMNYDYDVIQMMIDYNNRHWNNFFNLIVKYNVYGMIDKIVETIFNIDQEEIERTRTLSQLFLDEDQLLNVTYKHDKEAGIGIVNLVQQHAPESLILELVQTGILHRISTADVYRTIEPILLSDEYSPSFKYEISNQQ